jgi:hypothetical protein
VVDSNSRLRRAIESGQWLWWLAILGTVLRLGFVLHSGRAEHFYDEHDYDQIGMHLAHGQGFRNQWVFTAYRAPGQPMLVAVVFAFLGHNVVAVKVTEAILLAVLPFLVSGLGIAIGLNRFQANIAAALAAFHPALAFASGTLYPTALTTVALTLGIWFCARSMQKQRGGSAVAAGVALGIAGAATTTFVPVAFLAGLVMAARRRFRIGFIVALVGTLPAIAWMARNELVLHSFTLATNGGQNLALGANDKATPRSGNAVDAEVPPSLLAIGEVRADRIWRKQAEAWIRQHPARYAELATLRAALVFDSVGDPVTHGLISSSPAIVVEYALLPFMLLAILGLCLYRRQPVTWFTLCALSLVIASSAATIVKPRFRLPCDPALAIFSVGGAVQIHKRFLHSRGNPQQTKNEPRQSEIA